MGGIPQAATALQEKTMSVIELVTTTEFTELTSKHEWLLVDFFADWCGPCKMMGPAFERVAAKHQSSLGAAKANVDRLPRLAGTYQVRSIPTFILFRHGEVVDQLAGTHSEGAMDQWLCAKLQHSGT